MIAGCLVVPANCTSACVGRRGVEQGRFDEFARGLSP